MDTPDGGVEVNPFNELASTGTSGRTEDDELQLAQWQLSLKIYL